MSVFPPSLVPFPIGVLKTAAVLPYVFVGNNIYVAAVERHRKLREHDACHARVASNQGAI
ncbi:hypothetical protein [Propionivibrio soli]|uniref:hypothetical protein n=1 Tax=Propionivibrio soli TaxID=2976531 RepID=UPI0021E8B55F|nr:hypothetical protein [Propionivibrio soli]